MIKLKDLLFESEVPDLFISRRMDDRKVRLNKLTQQEVNEKIAEFIKYPERFNPPSVFSLTNDPKGEETSGPKDIKLPGEFIVPDTFNRLDRDFYLSNSNVTKLPDNLIIGGYLAVENCRKLKELPRGLRTDKVWAEASGVKIVHDDLVCKELYLEYTKVLELPLFKNFISIIDVSWTKFNKLPAGFTNCRELTLSFTDIQNIPNNVHVHTLHVTHCDKLISIGSGCKFDRLNAFSSNNLEIIANDLIVKENFHLSTVCPFFKKNYEKYGSKFKKALKKEYPGVENFYIGDGEFEM